MADVWLEVNEDDAAREISRILFGHLNVSPEESAIEIDAAPETPIIIEEPSDVPIVVEETNDIAVIDEETCETIIVNEETNIANAVTNELGDQSLNNSSDDCDAKENSEMTLSQGATESELSPPEEVTVNPDDLLHPVDKLEKYATSDLAFNRQVVSRNILETLRLCNGDRETISRVATVFKLMADDYDPTVCSELMGQLPHLIAFCKDVKLNWVIEQHFMPSLMELVGENNHHARKSAQTALLSVIEEGLLDYETICEKVCPLILRLTDSSQIEELRTESITLMCKIIMLIGKIAAEELFFDRFFDLCADSNNNIRKACASAFGDLCTTCGLQMTERILLPKFLVLCEDSAWCVRKACAENFTPVSLKVSKEIRWRELSFLYKTLLFDQSRWVRLTAYQALGPFISTFAEPHRTGLKYTKETGLIIDLPPELPTPNVMCNGDIHSTDITASTQCDNLVPSLSQVPVIPCHVGSNNSVINSTNCDEQPQPPPPKTSSNLDASLKELWDVVFDANTCDTNGGEEAKQVPMEEEEPEPAALPPPDEDPTEEEDCSVGECPAETTTPMSNDFESAFNNFQYWRDPLPDVDIDVTLEDVNRSPSVYKYKNKCRFVREPCTRNRRSKFLLTEKDSLDMESFQKPAETKSESTETLSVYDQDIVPPQLLKQYLNMVDGVWAHTIDDELARHCAYSFPAVALTLGRKFWPCLLDTFEALSSDIQGFIMMWKVRRTVASAMHQLAVILGPEITSRDLLPVFARFIHDLDEVRIGVLQHLYEFLKVLKPEERKTHLHSLKEFLVSKTYADWNEKNWRFRLILAEQLVPITELYEPGEVRSHLVPLSITLLKDKVCEVRLAAVRVVASIVRQFGQWHSPVYRKCFLSELTDNFLHSPKWLHRQLYVYISQECIAENALTADQLAEDFFPQLLYLCWDRVPNVRLAIARCLVATFWPLEEFSGEGSPHREILLQTLHILHRDSDSDVRSYACSVTAGPDGARSPDSLDLAEPFV